MKLIISYIKKHKLAEVTLAVHRIDGITGMSVIDGRGFGRGRAKEMSTNPRNDVVDFIPNVRIEIGCRDDITEQVISAIHSAAHTGLRGDGKIYVMNLENAYRISTDESGEKAI